VRVTASFINASASANLVSIGINGTSTGYVNLVYSNGGGSAIGLGASGTGFATIPGLKSSDLSGVFTITNGETRFNGAFGNENSSSSLLNAQMYMRIAQSADISSITFTGNQTSGIGAGSYIIVERVDADLSQDLGWQDYTPTCYIDLTSATTVPNITPSVRYRVQGKTLFMQGTLNFTGAPTGATDLSISLPTGVNVVSMASASKLLYAGSAGFVGTGTYQGRVRLPGSTENAGRIAFRPQTGIGTTGTVTPTSPFTWANTHQLEFDFFTEIQ
jgi:hypothetical protein